MTIIPENPTPSVDFYNLQRYGKSYLFSQLNIVADLESTLRDSSECEEIINRYGTLSNLFELIAEGPGTFELESSFYRWELILLLFQLRQNLTGGIILLRDNNRMLKNIEERLIPALNSKIDMLIERIDNLPSRFKTIIEPLFLSLERGVTNIITILNDNVIALLVEISETITEFEFGLNIKLEDNQEALLNFLADFDERVFNAFARVQTAITNINVNLDTKFTEWSATITGNINSHTDRVVANLSTNINLRFRGLNNRLTALFGSIELIITGIGELNIVLGGITTSLEVILGTLVAGLGELNVALGIISSKIDSLQQMLKNLESSFPSSWGKG